MTSKNTVVYSYEPYTPSFSLLADNIVLNELQNIYAFNLGVGKKKEKRRLYIVEDPAASSLYVKTRDYFDIQCISLKDIFVENQIEKCDILELDCEGAEYEILYATPNEYLEKIKNIRLEYHAKSLGESKEYNIKSLLDFLKERGFRVVKF